MDDRINLGSYLARKRRYMRLPRFVAVTLILLLILGAAMSTFAIGFVGSLQLLVASAGSLESLAIGAAVLLGIIALVVVGAIAIVGSFSYCYRRAFDSFSIAYLSIGLLPPAALVVTGYYDVAATWSAILLCVALYIWAGRAYAGTASGGRWLVRAPAPTLWLVSGRYGVMRREALGPVMRLFRELAKFVLITLCAAALLMAYPFAKAAGTIGSALNDAFSNLAVELDGQPPAMSPAPEEASYSFNPSFIIWIAYLIWLRPYLARIFVSAKRRFKADVARSAADLMERDTRPGILFLRSFTDDRLRVKRKRTAVEWLLGVPPSAPARLEETLVEVAFRFGPVAALRNPNPLLKAHLGAARDVSTDEAWQDYVRTKLMAVRDVIFILGRSEGLRWEMQTIEQYGLVDKLIVVVPPNAGWTEELLRQALPGAMTPPQGGGTAKPLVIFRDRRDVRLIEAPKDTRESYEQALLLAFTKRRESDVAA